MKSRKRLSIVEGNVVRDTTSKSGIEAGASGSGHRVGSWGGQRWEKLRMEKKLEVEVWMGGGRFLGEMEETETRDSGKS